ncbi:hypothetical protein R69888_02901 [Paraburkholderia haematera]|uniref:Uncharacterized protein n=1 Tax=Paraburkholderia haematera TaxID=2793077 RepID=A0ABM8RFA1_9BURK|nr:hypothetical protein R69888_02901 [Paraburkholderia haematera]
MPGRRVHGEPEKAVHHYAAQNYERIARAFVQSAQERITGGPNPGRDSSRPTIVIKKGSEFSEPFLSCDEKPISDAAIRHFRCAINLVRGASEASPVSTTISPFARSKTGTCAAECQFAPRLLSPLSLITLIKAITHIRSPGVRGLNADCIKSIKFPLFQNKFTRVELAPSQLPDFRAIKRLALFKRSDPIKSRILTAVAYTQL